MWKMRSSVLLCLLTLVIGTPVRARAQTVPVEEIRPDVLNRKIEQSHLLDPDKFGLQGLDPEQLFKQGLNKIYAKEILDQYKKEQGTGLKQLKDLIQQQPGHIQKFLQEFSFKNLPKDLQQRFEGREGELEDFVHSLKLEDLKRYAGAAEGLGSSPPSGASPAGTPPESQSPPAEPDTTLRPDPRPTESGATEDSTLPGAEGEDRKPSSVLGRWLLKTADRFQELDPSLRNSPALHQFIRELSRKVEGSDARWKELDQGASAIAEKWAYLAQTLPIDRLWPKQGLSWPQALTPRSFPNWKFPEMGRRRERQGPLTMPHTGLPALNEKTGWSALWMLVLLAGLGLLLWKLWNRSRATDLHGGRRSWKLGPWPVQPAAVRTREELIRAFEYLSLLRLGPAARHWHHWAIASALGRASGNAVPISRNAPAAEQRRSATQLALLYERARYAPPEEPLSEAALATARHDLCLLAGVPVS